ncbi:MAG: hypothetical protein WD061_03165 [Candidatus Saccharimonadales bacterium]
MNHRTIIATILILALAGGIAFAMWQTNDQADNGRSLPSPEDVQEDSEEPITEADERNRNNGDSSEQEDSDTSSNDSSDSDNRQIVIPTMTNWSWDNDNNAATIRAYVDGVSSGTCRVVLEKSGYTSIAREAPLALQGSIYVCQGFNIEGSAFPAGGQWSVYVEFSSDTHKGSSIVETLNVNL